MYGSDKFSENQRKTWRVNNMNIYYTCNKCGQKRADAFGVCDCTPPEEKDRIIKEMSLKPLDERTDLYLMMEFRQTRRDEWKRFCHERDYEPELRP